MPTRGSEPLFEPVACERLDQENAAWARQYVDKWQERLAADLDDPELACYARREIAAYEELLTRFETPRSEPD